MAVYGKLMMEPSIWWWPAYFRCTTRRAPGTGGGQRRLRQDERGIAGENQELHVARQGIDKATLVLSAIVNLNPISNT